jgi:hypothetical protein
MRQTNMGSYFPEFDFSETNFDELEEREGVCLYWAGKRKVYAVPKVHYYQVTPGMSHSKGVVEVFEFRFVFSHGIPYSRSHELSIDRYEEAKPHKYKIRRIHGQTSYAQIMQCLLMVAAIMEDRKQVGRQDKV